jgi:hypothetical protein
MVSFRRRGTSVALIVSCVSVPSLAAMSDLERLKLAMNLGSVLAAEGPCGFSYNQAAIRAYIAKAVPVDDMSFPQMLNVYTMSYSQDLGSMTPSQKTAACAQIERVARANSFLSP